MQRCELSDLPVAECACRKHKPGQAADARPGTAAAFVHDGSPGPTIAARYPGRCVTCGDQYGVGEDIRPVTTAGGTRWGHAYCLD